MGKYWGRDYTFTPNERVVAYVALGRYTGTLIRRARSPWSFRRAWVVELDSPRVPGGQRQYIAEVRLWPIAEVDTESRRTWKTFLPRKRM